MKLGYKTFLYLIVLNILTPEIAEACKPQINWGSSVSFCQGNSFTLNAANPNSTYVWSTGASSPSISVNSSGTYWVTVTNPCGTTSDTIQVIVDKPVNVNLGPNRSICNGTSTKLSVPFSPSSTYFWQNGSTGHQLNVSQAGVYHVAVTNACGTYRDTVVISVDNPQTVSLGQDIINCSNNPTVLTTPTGLTGSFLWSNGSKASSLSVTTSGKYWVRVTNACGVTADTVDVAFVGPGKLFATDTILFCNSGNLVLKSPVKIGTHLWSTNATTTSINITQAGKYWLTVTLPCGTFSDTIYLIGSSSNLVNLGPNVLLCPGDSVILDAGNPGSQFIWQNGATSQTLKTDTAGKFWVGANNGCGFVYDTVTVAINPLPQANVKDTVYVCQGNLATVNAGSYGPQTTYLWSDNSTSRINSNLGLGTHWLTVTNQCGTVTKSFVVKNIASLNINLGKDTVFCEGQIVLKSGVSKNGNSFLWSKGGNTTQNLTVTHTGTYWVKVTNACGIFTDTINVVINRKPLSIKSDTIFKCPGSGTSITTPFNAGQTYLWSTNATTRNIFVNSPGKYWMRGATVCDTVYDTVYVVDKGALQFSLGKDTTFCSPGRLTLNFVRPGIDSIVWQNGKQYPLVRLKNSGTYWATAYSACGSVTDSITIVVNDPPEEKLNDTTFCGTGSVVLDVTQPQATSYLWNTSATTSSITVNTVGWYYVDITTPCGTLRDSAYVNAVLPLPAINLGADTLFCAGQLVLNPDNFAKASYKWSTNDTSRSITVSQTGTYYVEISNSCNKVYDTINVVVTGPPQMVLGNNVKFCGGSTLNLNAQNPGCAYSWSNGDTSQTLSVTAAGKYWVTVANACGTITDSINVIVENPLSNINLGRDTAICAGDSILLDTQIPGVFTKWKNGSNMPSIYVKQTGDYWVQVSNSCGRWEDTIHVEVLDVPTFSLGNDTSICAAGGTQLLEAPANMQSYLWKDGSTASTFLATSAGKYWVTIANNCFAYTDTIILTEDFPIHIDLGPDTTLCYGESLELSANLQHQNFKWSSSNNSVPTQTITESGKYWLEANNSCGVFSDTINVTFEKPINTSTVDTTICDGDVATFDLSDVKEDFTWYDGKKDKVRQFDKEGDYTISLNNQCGNFTRTYSVNVTFCECPFFVANAFSPNGDGTNDEFKVGHSCDLSEYSIQIFNRWGQMVYEGHDADEGWDGTYKGTEAAVGIYTYKISYMWYVYGVDHVKEHTGMLTLMR